MRKVQDAGFSWKKRAGMRDQDPPFQTLALASILEAGHGRETHQPSWGVNSWGLNFHKICIYMRVEIVPCGTITWSEMGKQNIQVKKFYLIKRCIFSLALQRNLFPPDNPLYQRLTDLMQTRDPFYKPPQPSPVDETGASTKVSPTLLTFLLVETAP